MRQGSALPPESAAQGCRTLPRPRPGRHAASAGPGHWVPQGVAAPGDAALPGRDGEGDSTHLPGHPSGRAGPAAGEPDPGGPHPDPIGGTSPGGECPRVLHPERASTVECGRRRATPGASRERAHATTLPEIPADQAAPLVQQVPGSPRPPRDHCKPLLPSLESATRWNVSQPGPASSYHTNQPQRPERPGPPPRTPSRHRVEPPLPRIRLRPPPPLSPREPDHHPGGRLRSTAGQLHPTPGPAPDAQPRAPHPPAPGPGNRQFATTPSIRASPCSHPAPPAGCRSVCPPVQASTSGGHGVVAKRSPSPRKGMERQGESTGSTHP